MGNSGQCRYTLNSRISFYHIDQSFFSMCYDLCQNLILYAERALLLIFHVRKSPSLSIIPGSGENGEDKVFQRLSVEV